MGQLTRVALTSDVESGQAIAVEAGGQRIAIFNVSGEFHAIGDPCTHRGGPLSPGKTGRCRRYVSMARSEVRHSDGQGLESACSGRRSVV